MVEGMLKIVYQTRYLAIKFVLSGSGETQQKPICPVVRTRGWKAPVFLSRCTVTQHEQQFKDDLKREKVVVVVVGITSSKFASDWLKNEMSWNFIFL